jgi:hypothetical protein
MDWTDFDADGQATIMLSLLTRHGRATPLLWLTVDTATLKNHRNEYEYQALVRLADALPADIKVRLVADRGFGDQKLYRMLTEELKFDYVIRFRGNIAVTTPDGEVRTAAAWVGPGGRARVLRAFCARQTSPDGWIRTRCGSAAQRSPPFWKSTGGSTWRSAGWHLGARRTRVAPALEFMADL